jgi:hypothetical protein
MLDALSQVLGIPLVPEHIRLPDGTRVDVDGVSHEPPVLVEAWAHQGKPKSAQRNKVLSDALKLIHVAKILGGEHRRVLCFSDPDAARPFVGKSWFAAALRDEDVEVHVVALPGRVASSDSEGSGAPVPIRIVGGRPRTSTIGTRHRKMFCVSVRAEERPPDALVGLGVPAQEEDVHVQW